MNHARRAEVLCERTRVYVSLELDGELSEFEQGFLEAHLVRCSDCRQYRADLHAATRDIRETPLEVPAQRAAVPIASRRRATARLARYPLGAAAALAVAILGTATFVTPSIDTNGGITNAETFPTQLQHPVLRTAELSKPGRTAPPNMYAMRVGLDYIR